MSDSPQRKLAAVLSADVVGYSKLMSSDEAATLADLRQLRGELFEPVVARHNGVIVKRMGDGWLVEFGSVVDATNCAVLIQQGLDAHDRIKLRVGLHIGDIVHEDEDIYGDGVNIASRLQELADPGTVMVSEDAFRQISGKQDIDFRDIGDLQLKNIGRLIRTYQWPAARNQVKASLGEAAIESLSIAVLPFNNMSGDPEQEYFSDGIAEDIITELSRTDWLQVIARNTTFTFKGTAVDVTKVAAELAEECNPLLSLMFS